MAKHPKPCNKEIAFINSLKIRECPFYDSIKIDKNGKRNDGIQRYICHSCGKSFNPLTGTIFDSRKISMSEWVEFLLHLFEFHSLSTSSRDNINAETTGIYWLSNVFATLDGCQKHIVLKDKVWFDETFVPADKKERVTKDGKKLRGISKNLITIGITTSGKKTYAVVEWASKPFKRMTYDLFKDHIKPGPVLVHDGDNSHSKLTKGINPSKRGSFYQGDERS